MKILWLMGAASLASLVGCGTRLIKVQGFGSSSSPSTAQNASSTSSTSTAGQTNAEPAPSAPATAAAAPMTASAAPSPADDAAAAQTRIGNASKQIDSFTQAVQARCHDPKLLGDLTDRYGSMNTAQAEAYNAVNNLANGASDAEKQAAPTKRAAIDDAIASCIVVPPDQFHGSSDAAARKLFADTAAQSSSKPAVKVFINDADWDHKTGVNDDGSFYDNSFLHAYVVVGQGTRGEVWWVTMRQDHLNDDALKVDIYVPVEIAPIALPLTTH